MTAPASTTASAETQAPAGSAAQVLVNQGDTVRSTWRFALDSVRNRAVGQRFHNHSPLNLARLEGDPDHIERHLISYT